MHCLGPRARDAPVSRAPLATTSTSHSLLDELPYNPPPTTRPPPPRKHPRGLNDSFYHCSGTISIFLEFIFIDLDIFIDRYIYRYTCRYFYRYRYIILIEM